MYIYIYIDICKEAAALWQQSPQRMAAGNLVSASCQRLLQQAVHGPARHCLKASWRRPRHQAPGIRRRTASRTVAAHVLPHNPLKSPCTIYCARALWAIRWQRSPHNPYNPPYNTLHNTPHNTPLNTPPSPLRGWP